jgi:hypothetical protein
MKMITCSIPSTLAQLLGSERNPHDALRLGQISLGERTDSGH